VKISTFGTTSGKKKKKTTTTTNKGDHRQRGKRRPCRTTLGEKKKKKTANKQRTGTLSQKRTKCEVLNNELLLSLRQEKFMLYFNENKKIELYLQC